jgi:transcriptional regulator with XRE-family HTH domain
MGFHCPLNTKPKPALSPRAQSRMHGDGPGVPHTWTMADEPGPERETGLGGYIRLQRQLADLSLRQLADLTKVSNAYLSQVERGLHQPSLRVLRSIADALNLSADTLLTKAGMPAGRAAADAAAEAEVTTEAAIRNDPELGPEERETLLRVYRSLRRAPR